MTKGGISGPLLLSAPPMINETVRQGNERRRRCILMGGPPTINKQRRVIRVNLRRGPPTPEERRHLRPGSRRAYSVAGRHKLGALLQCEAHVVPLPQIGCTFFP